MTNVCVHLTRGVTIREIVTSVKRVSDIVSEIAAASRQQSVGIEEVNRAVMQMDQVTQQNAAQTEGLSATASTVAQQARDLESLVSWFKVDGAETGQGPALRTPRKSATGGAMQRRAPGKAAAPVGAEDAAWFRRFLGFGSWTERQRPPRKRRLIVSGAPDPTIPLS